MENINKLYKQIEKSRELQEKLDNKMCKLLWKKLKPKTKNLQGIKDCADILNKVVGDGCSTVGIFEMFNKLRQIKEKLKINAKERILHPDK